MDKERFKSNKIYDANNQVYPDLKILENIYSVDKAHLISKNEIQGPTSFIERNQNLSVNYRGYKEQKQIIMTIINARN